MEHLLNFYGLFSQHQWLTGSITILLFLTFGYFGSPLIVWSFTLFFILFGCGTSFPALFFFLLPLMIIFNIKLLRRVLFTRPIIMPLMKGMMPKISETERTALEAGVVWVEKDLFSGKPDFKKILNEPYPQLSEEEQSFLNHQVEKLCEMTDPWKIWKTREIDKEVWDYIKKEKFFGMIIPKEYGGLGFTAMANSEVVMKLASRSIPVAITVMVPNSLGPAELLVHYGTKEQKDYYLPRLATGEEVPCFALTEPGAGSDAGSIVASGELFKAEDGKLKIRLNWNKRYITLASVATLVGLGFKLRDPENLLGKGTDLGITCALIPAHLSGVVLGRVHDPLDTPFINCPTQGKDVVISVDQVVGGHDGLGKGWQMLMESLAAGRGISLPAQSVGGAKLTTRVVSAYGIVRQQFGVSIGKFEGIEEPMARIAGFTYGFEAMRRFTIGALDQGIKPPVITAMSKYYSTEFARKIANDGMDIVGGAGISMGPRNLLGQLYIASPIAITVEGANILTRTLIIFGQGALRAHPYAFKEVDAMENKDSAGFDQAFWGHIGHVVSNLCRSIVLSVTRGYAACSPVHKEMKMYIRRLTWASATFAILADVAMATLGGTLKFREKLTGRFADILAWMYICTATIRRFQADGEKEEDLAFAKFVLKYGLSEIQKSFDGIFDNMYAIKQKSAFGKIIFGSLHFIFKEVLGGWSRLNSIGSQATDHLQHGICEALLAGGEQRERMTQGIYIPKNPKEALGRIENAMKLTLQAEIVEKKVFKARRKGELPKVKGEALFDAAKEKKVISAEEYKLVKEAQAARWESVQVDDFSQEEFTSHKVY